MKAVIICGGRIENYGYIKEQIGLFNAELIICADGGYNHAVKMGIKPDLTVGDFDSISDIQLDNADIKTARIARYPAEKNLTDSEIAVSHAKKEGANAFLIVGALGTRADHALTNIFMLKNFLSVGINAQIIDEYNKIRMIRNGTRLEIKNKKGALVSLVPLCDCLGVTTEGLKYPLSDARLEFGAGRGVSNVMSGEEAAVSVGEGILLVIEARD